MHDVCVCIFFHRNDVSPSLNSSLTFDMSSVQQQAKPDVGRPLDGRVRRHCCAPASTNFASFSSAIRQPVSLSAGARPGGKLSCTASTSVLPPASTSVYGSSRRASQDQPSRTPWLRPPAHS